MSGPAVATRAVFEELAAEIAAREPSAFFGVMGDDTAALTAQLIRIGVPYYSARHEATAVMMADGYSWGTGRPAAALVSRGSGFLNAMNAARTAVRARRRVVVVSSDVASTGPTSRDLKYIDHGALAASIGMAHFPAAAPAEAIGALRGGYAAAQDGHPSFVSIAVDVLHRAGAGAEREPASAAQAPRPAVEPSDREVAEILTLLRASRRPLVLAGRGAVEADARELLVDLAERTGALLGTTLQAKDLFRGVPRDLGVVGGFSSDPAAPLLAEVDCVVVFGASLNLYTTGYGTLFQAAAVAHIDTDAGAVGAHLPVRVGVVADARATARRLRDALAGTEPPATWSAERLASLDRPLYAGPDEGQGELDPRILAMELDRMLPAERTLILDAGRFMAAPGRFMRVRGPDRFRLTVEGGSIGLGLGTAMGAALARPDGCNVLVTGDGGLAMCMQELPTLSRYSIPLVVIVMNDSSFGAERRSLIEHGFEPSLADFPETDFAAVAAVHGIESATIRRLDELEAFAQRFASRASPLLLDCRISSAVTTAHLEW